MFYIFKFLSYDVHEMQFAPHSQVSSSKNPTVTFHNALFMFIVHVP